MTEIFDRYKVDDISFLDFRNNVKMGQPIALALQDDELRSKARSPISFYNKFGDRIEDPATGKLNN